MKFNKNKKSNIYIIRGLDSNSIGEKKSITFLVLNLDIINYSLPRIGARCLWLMNEYILSINQTLVFVTWARQ